jgi:hypothetical protein
VLRLLRGSKKKPAELPTDPRYVNHPAQRLRVKTDESVYTLDGEILPHSPEGDGLIDVSLGPILQLAVTNGVNP